jgi:hypothetical protein
MHQVGQQNISMGAEQWFTLTMRQMMEHRAREQSEWYFETATAEDRQEHARQGRLMAVDFANATMRHAKEAGMQLSQVALYTAREILAQDREHRHKDDPQFDAKNNEVMTRGYLLVDALEDNGLAAASDAPPTDDSVATMKVLVEGIEKAIGIPGMLEKVREMFGGKSGITIHNITFNVTLPPLDDDQDWSTILDRMEALASEARAMNKMRRAGDMKQGDGDPG